MCVRSPATGQYEIQDKDDEGRVRYVVPATEEPLHFDGQHLLVRSTAGKPQVIRRNIETDAARSFDIPPSGMIAAERESVWLDTDDGQLVRLDLATGKLQTMASARPRQIWTRPVTYFGSLAIWMAWLTWLWLSKSQRPFVCMLLVLACTAATFLIWWQFGEVNQPETLRWLQALTQVSFGTLLAVGLIWLSTFRSLGSTSLPIGILGTITVLVVFLNSIRLDIHQLNFVIVAGGIIGFHVIGLVAFRFFFGQLRPESSASSPAQLSLRQLVVAVTLCGILFAVSRNVAVPLGLTRMHVAWAILFAATFSFSSCCGIYAGIKIRNGLAGLLLCMGASVGISYLAWQVSEGFGYELGSRTLMVYGQPIVCTAVVFVTLQLAKRTGYTFVRAYEAN